jgi:hypothetical protein
VKLAQGIQKKIKFCALLITIFTVIGVISFIIPFKILDPQLSAEKSFSHDYQTIQKVSLFPALPAPDVHTPVNSPNPMFFIQQLGCTFTQAVPSLNYSITAVAQSGTDGYGPAYLLNGLSNTGYWYQVGLAYNWDHNTALGFNLFYEVFDPSGKSIYPFGGWGGIAKLSPVIQGDTIVLNLSISDGNVIMQGTDLNTGAQAKEMYSAEGATIFIGSPSSPFKSHGFFTGLMTEWYHTSPYYGGQYPVAYINNSFPIASSWVWIHEFVFPPTIIGQTYLFRDHTSSAVTFNNMNSLYTFSSNGANIACNSMVFITGDPPPIPIFIALKNNTFVD